MNKINIVLKDEYKGDRIMPQKLILNIMGEAPYPGAMCLNHGHGYYAYTNTMNSNLRFLLKKFCIWSNSTDTKELIDGSVYLQYELDCNCKDFVTSPMFKLICEQANTELIICDSYDNAQPLREFFVNIKTR